MDWPTHRQQIFRGVNEAHDFLIDKDQSSGCKNVLLDHLGSVRSGNGRIKRNGTVITTTPDVLDLYRFYLSNGTKKFLAGAGTNLYLGAETSPYNFTSIKASLTTGLKGRYETFKDKCWRVNGTDANLKYDGTNVVNMGVETPTAPAVATGAAGNLTGDYYYKVSYQVDSYSEGNASVASSLVQPSSEKVTVTKPTSTPEADVTHWIIYRTKAGATTYYKLASVAIGTGTYSDDVIDTSLDTGSTAPADNSAPGVVDFIALQHRYIFLADKTSSRVYFCTQDYPEKYPAAYYFDINAKDGENINGLLVALGSMYCFKPNAIYAICGNDVDDFGVPPNKWSKYGCYAPDTLVEVNWKGSPMILYLHKTGVRAWDGTLSHPLSSHIQTTIESIDPDYIHLACAELKGNEYWISFCTSGTANNETWILNLETGDWREMNYGCNGFMVEVDDNLYSAQDDGWVHQQDTGTTDLGGDLTWEYYGKNFSWPHEEGIQNKARYLEIWASLLTDDLVVTLTVDNDSTNKQHIETLSNLGSSLVHSVISLPMSLKGEFFKPKYSGTGQNRCTIREVAITRIPISRRL